MYLDSKVSERPYLGVTESNIEAVVGQEIGRWVGTVDLHTSNLGCWNDVLWSIDFVCSWHKPLDVQHSCIGLLATTVKNFLSSKAQCREEEDEEESLKPLNNHRYLWRGPSVCGEMPGVENRQTLDHRMDWRMITIYRTETNHLDVPICKQHVHESSYRHVNA